MTTLIPQVWVAASTESQMLEGGMHAIEIAFGLAHFILILAYIVALALGLVRLISAVQNLFNGAERVAAKYRSQQSADEPPAKAEPTPKTPRNEA